ncbi:MAG: hypothetical protein EA397_10210 [Deltaproteobacteria bacterium]|nr:MAG: hypothetical protein EA397_10210 [Deltaproteobacteria bacterium]
MTLALPHVHVRLEADGPRVDSSHPELGISRSELERLLDLDRESSSVHPPGDRAYPLEGGRWAIGRGSPSGFTWRIVPSEVALKLRHPAWLWRSSRWFDHTAPPTGPIPGPLPLRTSIEAARRLAGGSRPCACLIAGVVAALRTQELPVAILLGEHDPEDAVHASRWFLLSLLTLLPRPIREVLRLSGYEHRPDPSDWDVILTSEPPEGFFILRIGEDPALADDLPATFLFDRLQADALEQAEEASGWYEPDADDPWAEGIAPRWNQSRPTLAEPGAPSLGTGRLRQRSPEAWLSLVGQPEAHRAREVKAWLDGAPEAPSEDVLGAITRVRPRNSHSDAWARALLRWADEGPSAMAATLELGVTLEREPLPMPPAVLSSLWTEYVMLLLHHARFSDALAACESPAAHTLIAEGAGQVVADAWVHLPSSRRPEGALLSLVDELLASPNGPDALAQLWQALMVDEHDGRADMLLRRIASTIDRNPDVELDPLLSVLAQSPQAMRWVGHVARHTTSRRLSSLVSPVTSGPHDPLWEHCIDVRAQVCPAEVQIADQLGMPEAQIQRAERELRERVAEVQFWRFPDVDIADGAARLALADGASPIWSWLEICARPPERNGRTNLATRLTRLCAFPPAQHKERRSLWVMTECMGSAEGWSAASHAALLVRFSLTSDPEDGSFILDLSTALARGVAKGAGGAQRLAHVTDELCTLPEGHPATETFLRRILPVVYTRGVPKDYIKEVNPSKWHKATLATWQRVVKSLGSPT